jgi:hypothetical protein
MEDTKALLHEAAAWERLVREVDVVFDTGDLARIAAHISVMQHSAAALRDMPDSDRRGEVLAGVSARFETTVLPMLTDALHRDDVDELKKMVHVFDKLGRLHFVCAEFAKTRVQSLVEAWSEGVDTGLSLTEWIGELNHATAVGRGRVFMLLLALWLCCCVVVGCCRC